MCENNKSKNVGWNSVWNAEFPAESSLKIYEAIFKLNFYSLSSWKLKNFIFHFSLVFTRRIVSLFLFCPILPNSDVLEKFSKSDFSRKRSVSQKNSTLHFRLVSFTRIHPVLVSFFHSISQIRVYSINFRIRFSRKKKKRKESVIQ